MRAWTVYVDESGHSGDASSAAEKPLDDQPVFALVGLAEVTGSDRLGALLRDLREHHKIKSVEVKGRVMDRRPELVPDLLRELRDRQIPVFVELMDKRYFVATNIVDHVLRRHWADVSSAASGVLANAFADLLSERLDNAVLAAYGTFALTPGAATFESFVDTFRRALFHSKVISAVDDEQFELTCVMEKALHSSLDSVGDGGRLEEFLPPPDLDRRGNRLPMLPHVPALTNLYARINWFARGGGPVRVIHDDQLQLGPILADSASVLESNQHFTELARATASKHVDWDFSGRNFGLEFDRSTDHPGIQLADMVARFCTRQLASIILNGDAHQDLRRVAPLLRALRDPTSSSGINVVSTTTRADLFHGA